ncbi:MAG TPA: hypothetical protein VIU81_05745 [Gaiellaceae bacterium]
MMLGDTPLNVGAVVSATTSLNVADREFPCASVAVHVTVVVPSGKVPPDEGVQTGTTGPSTRSRADAGL